MLSISPPISGARAGNYYTVLSRDDYYTGSDQQIDEWLGEGAAELRIKGRVLAEQFASLLKGFDPTTGEPLVQNAGNANRQCGWDLTFSAPKSVSVAWALGSEEERAQIEVAHRRAVASAVKFLERECAFTRRGKGGRELESTKLVAAAFEHTTSRALDPQLHTHVVVINVCPRADFTTGSLVSQPLFDAKMAAGALYRAELASQLARLGADLKSTKHGFEVVQVPEEICSVFSKRSHAIAAHSSAWDSAETKKRVTLETRPAKKHVDRTELFGRWNEEAKAHGYQAKQLCRNRPEVLSTKERQLLARECRLRAEKRTRAFKPGSFSITPPAQRVVLKLLSEIAQKGGVVTAIKERKVFRKAPAWSPFSRITQTKLFIGRYAWGKTHWSVTLVPGKLRLSVRDRWLFPAAPSWNPVSKLKMRGIRIEAPPLPRKTKKIEDGLCQ